MAEKYKPSEEETKKNILDTTKTQTIADAEELSGQHLDEDYEGMRHTRSAHTVEKAKYLKLRNSIIPNNLIYF